MFTTLAILAVFAAIFAVLIPIAFIVVKFTGPTPNQQHMINEQNLWLEGFRAECRAAINVAETGRTRRELGFDPANFAR